MPLLFAVLFAALYALALRTAGQPTPPAFAFAGPAFGFLALAFTLAHVGKRGRA